MLFSSGYLSGAAISQAALLKSSLRMRPDYVVIGELRDQEAGWVHVNEVMAGHPGSLRQFTAAMRRRWRSGCSRS
jgi:type IV secretion system protein VirB11